MNIKVGGITRKEFDENALWVIKFDDGHRVTGKYHDLENSGYLESNDIRDIDLICEEGQPDIIKPFMKVMHEIDDKYGWMTIPEIFDRFGVRC